MWIVRVTDWNPWAGMIGSNRCDTSAAPLAA
jgi:hypothetical protein